MVERTLHLDATVGARELAPRPVADALLDGARARSAAVRRRPDDAARTPTSAEPTARAACRPRLPAVRQHAVHR